MVGRGNPTAIGPFGGGLNTLEDPRIIGNDQLASCTNMDIGRSGELIMRTGLQRIRNNVAPVSDNISLIGVATGPTGTNYAFVKDTTSNTIYYTSGDVGAGITGSTTTWTQLSTQFYYGNKLVQYNDMVIFIPQGITTGIYCTLTPTGLTSVITTTGIPQGNNGIIFKDRLFVFGITSNVPGSAQPTPTVSYSASTNALSFPVANFFKLNPGDGEGVNASIILGDALVLFKTRSTYALYFDTDPGLGTIRRISDEIGTSSALSVVRYENVAYLIARRTVYRIQNLLFLDIGRNLNLMAKRNTTPVQTDNTKQDVIFAFNTKLFLIVYTSTGYLYYIYNVEVDAWAQYTFDEQPNRFNAINDTLNGNSLQTWLATKNNSSNLYLFSPSNSNTYGDYPSGKTAFYVKTKKYAFTDSTYYKRMFWWGMDALIGGITDTAQFTAYSDSVASTTSSFAGTADKLIKFYKNFNAQRGRFFEFEIMGSASSKVELLPGYVHVAQKNDVTDAISL